jgi:dTDP-4-dehydrorhamnose reductase
MSRGFGNSPGDVKVLILGSNGQVGRLLVPAFPEHEVRGTSRVDFDIRDRDAVQRAILDIAPDAVILAAGLADADFCEDHPGDAYAVNVDGTRNVAEAARGRHFTLFSTDHIFDGKSGPYAEEDKPGPLSVYGRTKFEAERIVRAVHLRSLVIRTSLIYAPGDGSFFSKLLQEKDPMNCWTDHFGTYTWGPNLAQATAELVIRGETGIWHIVGPGLLNRHEFALKVLRRFGRDTSTLRPVSIHDAPPRAPRPLRAGLRVEKAQAALRTKMLSVDESLELAYRAYGRP